MTTLTTLTTKLKPLAQTVSFTTDDMVINLIDGRKITVPLLWFPSLCNATDSKRNHYELLGDGEGIHWPDLDEDISVNGLLQGNR